MPTSSTPLGALPPPQVIPGGAIGLNLTVFTERDFRSDGLSGGRGLVDLVADGVDASRPLIVPHVVAALQGPESLWPVDTGLSKASFRGRGRGRQDIDRAYAAVINTALNRRGKTYAQYVERGVPHQPQNFHAARRTVRRLRARIVARIQAQMQGD